MHVAAIWSCSYLELQLFGLGNSRFFMDQFLSKYICMFQERTALVKVRDLMLIQHHQWDKWLYLGSPITPNVLFVFKPMFYSCPDSVGRISFPANYLHMTLRCREYAKRCTHTYLRTLLPRFTTVRWTKLPHDTHGVNTTFWVSTLPQCFLTFRSST